MKTKTTKIVKGKYIHNDTQYYLVRSSSEWIAANQVTDSIYLRANTLKELLRLCDQEYQIINN